MVLGGTIPRESVLLCPMRSLQNNKPGADWNQVQDDLLRPAWNNLHTSQDLDLVTARINYRFGGPAVARY